MAWESGSPDAVLRARVTMGERLHPRAVNGKLRDKVLDGTIFYMLLEVGVLTEAVQADS